MLNTKRILINYKQSRSSNLEIIARIEKILLANVRRDREYKMPQGYISWETLSKIVTVGLVTSKECGLSVPGFVHSYRMSSWFVGDYPIYCIKPEILDAFDNTNVLEKPGILANWQPSMPYFVLTFPKKRCIEVPDGGKLDYLVIYCGGESARTLKYCSSELQPFFSKYERYIQIAGVDSRETVWMSGTAVERDGKLIHDGGDCGTDALSPTDRAFINRLRNLAIGATLAIEYTPELLSDVSAQETRNKGFNKPTDCNPSIVRYPRWLGENYQRKVCSEQSDIHASPHSHWRRGHWRNLEAGDGKRWKENRKLWIEPVFVGN
ncbi:hypothetical protein QT972_00110 [Microcoleus sp. herbarium7]|uniref:hypothetical protein n=1 Tax=Microcoleus sp. herbarium7 TaxID=3055435 RepID=UPI002FCEC496